MTSAPASCVHEQDVLDLVAIDQWPARADGALRAHVESCDVCGDLALVAVAFSAAENRPDLVRVPDATIVWYGARLMARLDHTRRAARPVMVVQAAAAASVVVVAAVLWRAFGPLMLAWLRDAWPGIRPGGADLIAWFDALSPRWRWLCAGLLAWGISVPLALGLARFADRGGETEAGRPRL